MTKLRRIAKVQGVSVHFSTTGGQSPGPVVVLMDFDGSTPTEAVADVLWSSGYTGAGEAAAQLVAEHGAPFQPGKFARVQVWAEPASSRTPLH